MGKKLFCISLALLLVNVICLRTTRATPKDGNNEQFVERVKEQIRNLGTGPDALIEVKLRDNTKLKGYVSEAGNESFVIVDTKTHNAETISYPQVKKVKGHNLSSGAKIAIGVGIGIGILAVLIVIFKPHIDAY
jgi:hypothetical protein